MRIGVKGIAVGALTLAALALSGGAAQAQGPVLEDGKTKAVYDYKTAVRERVFIPQPGIDADRNGAEDWVTIDIIRPAESTAANKMPAIIDPSPYYTTLCRGNESQCMEDFNGDGVTDQWPLFYDNYFVPRGYAYILAQMNGTGITQHGCPHHGGPSDIAGFKSVIDWLNGRVPGFSSPTRESAPKVADWHNGSSAMIGKSYDGTLANGTAATGVEGLKTIVPVSAISAWYNYSRTGGVRHNTNYPGVALNPQITWNGTSPTLGWNTVNPALGLPITDRRTTPCAPINSDMNNDANVDTGDGDTHGDVNTFWRDRDYNKDAAKVKASVFITHGLQDTNVRMDHAGLWYDALKANGVATKIWMVRAGHEDPFESRRLEWVNTLHRWFDHYLYGVNNGIQNEKSVTVEEAADVWGDYNTWPIDGTQNVDLFLRATDVATAPGTLGATAGGGAADTLGFNASTGHQRGQPDGHADRRPDQPPRVPLAAAGDRPAPVRHGGRRHRRLARRDAEQPQRRRRRVRRHHAGLDQQRGCRERDDALLLGRLDRRDHVRGRADRHLVHRADGQRRARVLPRRHQAADDDERHHGIPRHARHP